MKTVSQQMIHQCVSVMYLDSEEDFREQFIFRFCYTQAAVLMLPGLDTASNTGLNMLLKV